VGSSRAQYCNWRGDEPGSHAKWYDEPCSVACIVTADHTALCVDSATPVPECKNDGDACWNGGTTHCAGGYPTQSKPCDTGTQCVVATECGALCVMDPKPDSRCGPEKTSDGFYPSPGSLCDAGVLSACNCGYIMWRSDCGAPDLCRVVGGAANCVLSSTPDPRCSTAQEDSGYCDGNSASSCWWGYSTGSSDCGAGTCTVDSLGAGCSFSASQG
jgi:hypothetical protein